MARLCQLFKTGCENRFCGGSTITVWRSGCDSTNNNFESVIVCKISALTCCSASSHGWTCTFLTRGRLAPVPGSAGVTDGCWSKSGFSPSLFCFLALSLSPHNNPTAVLMVTLSAKSEGLDFYRTHELSTVPAVETLLSLSLSLLPSTFIFLSVSTECFISSSQDPFVSFIWLLLSSARLSSLLVESTVPSLPPPGFVSSSKNPNHDWALSVSVYKSNSNLISFICCAIVLVAFVSLYLQTACLHCIMFSRLC